MIKVECSAFATKVVSENLCLSTARSSVGNMKRALVRGKAFPTGTILSCSYLEEVKKSI
jgi:hypothetical protein